LYGKLRKGRDDGLGYVVVNVRMGIFYHELAGNCRPCSRVASHPKPVSHKGLRSGHVCRTVIVGVKNGDLRATHRVAPTDFAQLRQEELAISRQNGTESWLTEHSFEKVFAPQPRGGAFFDVGWKWDRLCWRRRHRGTCRSASKAPKINPMNRSSILIQYRDRGVFGGYPSGEPQRDSVVKGGQDFATEDSESIEDTEGIGLRFWRFVELLVGRRNIFCPTKFQFQ